MPGLADSVYMKSPVWFQQVGVAAYGWWWYRRRFGTHFHRLVAELSEREHWTAGQFRRYQEERLRHILAAARNSAYYAAILGRSGITADAPPFEALAQMPLLTKETLRTRAGELLTQTPTPEGTIVQRSSGTTGTPSEIYYTPEFHALEMAVPAVRNLGWAGVTHRERRVMFGVRKVCRFEQSRPPFWRFSPAENMAYASIYHLSREFLPHYVAFLRRYRPGVIMGYPSALNTVAAYALETGETLPPAKGVFTTSETVTAQIRANVEAAWRCRIYDRYGAVEGCLFASECEHGRYHVSPEVGIIEILDRNGAPCAPGLLGEVVCTGLQNALQPLIRYRIGDAARWAVEQACPCRRSMPILEAIEGRFEDICRTPDGRQMLRFDTVFKGVHSIREAQVVQERLDCFTVNVVPAPGFGEDDVAHIRSNMRAHVGDVQTQVREVAEIPRSTSGKFRAVVCNVPADQRASPGSQAR